MLRKKVLSVSPTKATLLVEESATSTLKVLRRVNTSSWSPADVEGSQRLYGVLAQASIPVIAETDNVVFQSSYLNIVSPYFVKGELASHLRSNPDRPPTDAHIARWMHVVALGVQSIHRLGFVHAALKLSKVYLTDDRGAAGIVLGAPQPLPLYREALDEARQRSQPGAPSSDADDRHRHFYNDDSHSAAPHHMQTAAAGSSTSLFSNVSVHSLELNYPPEVLHSAASRELHYTTESDVWHLGAMLMALAAAHGQLQRRCDALHALINDMCDDTPSKRASIADIIRRLVVIQSGQGSSTSLSVNAPLQPEDPSSIERSVDDDELASGADDNLDPTTGHTQMQHLARSGGGGGEKEVLRSSASPDPTDPRLATLRFNPPPPLTIPKLSTAATVYQPEGSARQRQGAARQAQLEAPHSAIQSKDGIVLTPRGRADQRKTPPPNAASGAVRASSSAATRAAASTRLAPQQSLGAPSHSLKQPTVSQRLGRVATPTRAHSRAAGAGGTSPTPMTAAKQAQNATSAYLIHAFERHEAEQQRRRDEQTRELERKREEQVREKEIADAAHRQHMDNLRRIHNKKRTDTDHRVDIRNSIKLWQQRQQHHQGGVPLGEDGADNDTVGGLERHRHHHTLGSGGNGGIVLDEGHGVVVFATAVAPPPRQRPAQHGKTAGTKQQQQQQRQSSVGDTGLDDDSGNVEVDPNVNYVVESPRRTVKRLPHLDTATTVGSVITASDASVPPASTSYEPQQHRHMQTKYAGEHSLASGELTDDGDRTADDASTPLTPSSSTIVDDSSPLLVQRRVPATSFEITPPRKRRAVTAAAAGGEHHSRSAPKAAGGVLPFQKHDQPGPLPTAHQIRDGADESRGGQSRSRSSTPPNSSRAGVGTAAMDAPETVRAAGQHHRDPNEFTSQDDRGAARNGKPSTSPQTAPPLQQEHISATAALEWTAETLRRSITHGPWRSLRCPSGGGGGGGSEVLLISRLLHIIDEFICLPAQARVQLKENAQLFERVRRLVMQSRRPSTNTGEHDGVEDDDEEGIERKEGLFAVVAPLVCQLVAVEGTLALSRELREDN